MPLKRATKRLGQMTGGVGGSAAERSHGTRGVIDSRRVRNPRDVDNTGPRNPQ